MPAKVAIIVPVHGHSGLVSEALGSALSLTAAPPVIAIDDGCPDPQTKAVLDGWAQAAPQLHRISQPNLGLSGARNTGIAFAMARYPELDALFFLDADNRLDATAMETWERMLRRYPNADWFYPNFDMFGTDANLHAGGPYSVALMSSANLCDAGSLVRRRVFDEGIRFDTGMLGGYEDWDFFLTASAAGFRGRPADQSFLRYRKRPESMLSGAFGKDEVLRGRIHQKHRWLYDRDHVARHALEMVADTVMVDAESLECRLYRGVEGGEQTTLGAEIERSFTSRARPEMAWSPGLWCFVRPGLLDAFDAMSMTATAHWYLRRGTYADTVSTLRLRTHPQGRRDIHYDEARSLNEQKLSRRKAGDPTARERARLAQMKSQADRDALAAADAIMINSWVLRWRLTQQGGSGGKAGDLVNRIAQSRVAATTLLVEKRPDLRLGNPLTAFQTVAGEFRKAQDTGVHTRGYHTWRDRAQTASPEHLREVVRKQTHGGWPLPLAAGPGLRIGFVTSIFRFGGVEKCIVAIARALSALGVRCHLFVYGIDGMTPTPWLTEPFESIHILNHPKLRDWRGDAYLGTRMASEPEIDLSRDMLAPLCAMDCVVVSGCAGLCHVLGPLRAKGILTVSWEHLVETSDYGRPYGTPYLALAYEGGFDLILTCSNQLKTWLHGHGVPGRKLLALPNGPGFPLGKADRDADLTERQAYDGPLRVGFLGRFDRQKGVDRFVRIAARLRSELFRFSMTGSAIVEGADDLVVPDWIEQHPPAYALDDLRAAFRRLDVLLMPSRHEGLPLSVLEAQRAGVIPVAADVGAVAEVVLDGKTGFLLSSTNMVGAASEILGRLQRNPDLRTQISAVLSHSADPWPDHAQALLDRLLALRAARRSETDAIYEPREPVHRLR